MRDIASAAGHRNNSAVQYHFGNREGLLLAIFRFRMHAINEVRRAYLDRVESSDGEPEIRALVEAEIRPLTEFLADAPAGSYYARFLARVSPSVDFTSPELTEVQDAGRKLSSVSSTRCPTFPVASLSLEST